MGYVTPAPAASGGVVPTCKIRVATIFKELRSLLDFLTLYQLQIPGYVLLHAPSIHPCVRGSGPCCKSINIISIPPFNNNCKPLSPSNSELAITYQSSATSRRHLPEGGGGRENVAFLLSNFSVPTFSLFLRNSRFKCPPIVAQNTNK